MPPVCQVCRHPEAARIALALVAGDSSRDVAGRWPGISKSAVHRHRRHALAGAAIVRAVEARANREAESLVQEISRLKADAARLAAKAEAEHDYRGALGAVKLLTDVALRLEELMPANEESTGVEVRFVFDSPETQRYAESSEARRQAQHVAATERTVDAASDGIPEDGEVSQPIVERAERRPEERTAEKARVSAPDPSPFQMFGPLAPGGRTR